jgi:hypothetical protein
MSYTTLIEDTTDTTFESGLPTRVSLPKRTMSSSYMIPLRVSGCRENFTSFVKGISSPGTTVEKFTEHFDNIDVYSIDFKNTAGQSGGSNVPSYQLNNTNGVMSIIHTDANGAQTTYIQVSDSGEVKFKVLDDASTITPSPGQTLVPIVVDSTGKVFRGGALFQNLITLDTRLSQMETLASQLRQIHNQSHFTNLTL